MGCFNATSGPIATTTNPVNHAPYGQAYNGSSLVISTQLNPSGPHSEGILTYSQASDPTSPWYSNMTKLYSQSKWVPLASTAKQLTAELPAPIWCSSAGNQSPRAGHGPQAAIRRRASPLRR